MRGTEFKIVRLSSYICAKTIVTLWFFLLPLVCFVWPNGTDVVDVTKDEYSNDLALSKGDIQALSEQQDASVVRFSGETLDARKSLAAEAEWETIFTRSYKPIQAAGVSAPGRMILIEPRYSGYPRWIVTELTGVQALDISSGFPPDQSSAYRGGIWVWNWRNWFSVTADESGTPLVVYTDFNDDLGGNSIRVVTRVGDSWVHLGDQSLASDAPGDDNMQNVIAMAANNTPVVVWTYASSPGDHLFAASWNGSAWVPMGPGATNEGQGIGGLRALDPALTIDATGAPVVAYCDYSNVTNPEIIVRRWNGSSW